MISSRQKLVIFLTLVLAALIFFAPKIKEEIAGPSNTSEFSLTFEEARKNLSGQQKDIFDRLEGELKKAGEANNEQAWIACADGFLKSARFIQGDKKAVLYKGAIDAYNKALALNPASLSAKTNLGTAIVEGSSLLGTQPMQGITLLREVVQQDPTNIEANLQLGLFSVTSQQFDKALERFNKILAIDSTHIDMYVYLGDTYLQMGEKQKAIESYESYKSKVSDTLIVRDIDEYIKKLKNQP